MIAMPVLGLLAVGSVTASASASSLSSSASSGASVETASHVISLRGQDVVAETTTKYGTMVVTRSTIRPDSSQGCTGTDPKVCLVIDGSGLYVNIMINESLFRHATRANLIVKSASGHIYASKTEITSPGQWLAVAWFPQNYEPSGVYCAGTIITTGPAFYACGSVIS